MALWREQSGVGVSAHLQVLADTAAGRTLRALGSAIAPPRCANCDWFETKLFCDWCAPRLRAIPDNKCDCCGEPFDPLAQVLVGSICADCRDNRYHGAPTITRARSLWNFSGPARRAVHRLKYGRQWSLAAKMGAQMADFAQRDGGFDDVNLVVPVPLFAWRQWRRGFNQSQLLAEAVAHQWEVPHFNALRRVRHTPSQTSLKRGERQSNVREAFEIAPDFDIEAIIGRGSVLLVDDVYTTGATLRECARQLQLCTAPHPISIYALTWARQPKPQLKHDTNQHVPAPL